MKRKPGNTGEPRRFAIEIVRLDGRRKAITYHDEHAARKRFAELRTYRRASEPELSLFRSLALVDRALERTLEITGRDHGTA